MCKTLVVFEYNDRGGVPEAALVVAACAEGHGAEVRLRALEAAGLRDISWADALAFGIDGRGARLPAEAKHWLDALGFGGWRHLRDKVGCVFATRGRGSDSAAVCGLAARIFRSRGMETVTPAELGVPEPPHDDDGTAVGDTFARWCARLEAATSEMAPRTAESTLPASPAGKDTAEARLRWITPRWNDPKSPDGIPAKSSATGFYDSA